MANPPAAPAKPGNEKSLKTISPLEEVKNQLLTEESKKQFMMALPPQMPAEKFIRVAITAVNKNPDLLRCDRQGLYGAFMLAAQDGLLPDGREAAIVVYGDKPQYMPMYGGILKKVRNSGELASLAAHIVYANDQFEHWIDDQGEHIKHTPETFGTRGEIRGAYALAKTKDGAVYLEVMSIDEIEKVRSASKAKSAGPWTQWWDQMAKKTAIRRLSKRLPMSTDLDEVIRRDDEMYDVEAKVVETPKKKDTPSRLSTMLGDAGPVIEAPENTPSDAAGTEPPKK